MPSVVAPYRLTPLDLASGGVHGVNPLVGPLPHVPAQLTARAALEAAVHRGLQRPPCLVSFSGGRDSSAVLALTAYVARREALPPPVPVTLRFPGCADADEDRWQETVVSYLGVSDWIRLKFDDELDIVGPHARAVFERHGQLWPYNVHTHLPLAEQGPGGSLLTGFGGDELFIPGGPWDRANQVIARQVRPTGRDLVRIAAAYGPAPLRRAVIRRRPSRTTPRPWLRPEIQHVLTDASVREFAAMSVRWDLSVDRDWWRTRYRSAAEDSLTRVGAMYDVAVSSPLIDASFLAAFAREGGRTGFATRTAATKHLVGDLLPPDLLSRESKAEFTGALWNKHSAEFARAWDGSGVDPELVDVDALRKIWNGTALPDARTFCILQSARWAAVAMRPLGHSTYDFI